MNHVVKMNAIANVQNNLDILERDFSLFSGADSSYQNHIEMLKKIVINSKNSILIQVDGELVDDGEFYKAWERLGFIEATRVNETQYISKFKKSLFDQGVQAKNHSVYVMETRNLPYYLRAILLKVNGAFQLVYEIYELDKKKRVLVDSYESKIMMFEDFEKEIEFTMNNNLNIFKRMKSDIKL